MTTGMDLRLRRVGLRLTVSQVASAMGVSPSRVSHIESRDRVTAEAEEKYVSAIQTLTTVPASSATAAAS